MTSDGANAFSIAPRLVTGELVMLPFSRKHFTEEYVSWLNDPIVVRYSEQRHRRHTIQTCRAYVESFAQGPSLLWAIEEDGAHVGNISASVDAFNGIADVGILIGHAAARGRGVGRRAWECVVTYLAGQRELRKVTGGCLESNVAMRRIMESMGMKFDGRRVAHYRWEGQDVDVVYLALFTNPQR